MTSTFDFYVAGYPMMSGKAHVDPILMTLFRQSDKKVYERRFSERSQLTWGDPDDEDFDETAYVYAAPVTPVIERLEIMGFTLARARQNFIATLADCIESYRNSLQSIGGDFAVRTEAYIQALEELTFDDLLVALREILTRNLVAWNTRGSMHRARDPYLWYALIDSFYGCGDIRLALRVLLEVCDKQEKVILDYTDLVHAGWYEEDEDLCEEGLEDLRGDFPQNERVIILTEGSSDRSILELTLRVLYPYLQDYYTFLNFDTADISGGTGSLVHNIKAFVSSGIRNRVIGLFDNDAAGSEAIRGAWTRNLPQNIKVLQLPSLDLARTYPTTGPQGGNVSVDINGSACSIELYLGVDVLTDEDGNLIPVRWTSYIDKVEKYQGELQNKRGIQKKYIDLLTAAEIDDAVFRKHDWSAMKQVFETIFEAFNQLETFQSLQTKSRQSESPNERYNQVAHYDRLDAEMEKMRAWRIAPGLEETASND